MAKMIRSNVERIGCSFLLAKQPEQWTHFLILDESFNPKDVNSYEEGDYRVPCRVLSKCKKKKRKENRLEKKCNKYRNNAWTLVVLYLMFCGTITCARSTK